MDSSLTQTQKTVLDLLSVSLFGRKKDFPGDTDWGEVWRESFFQAVSSFCFSSFDFSLISDNTLILEIKKLCKDQFLEAVSRYNSHIKLDELLSSNNIPYTIIKGCASSEYYPEPLIRPVGDVDFLVNKDDLERAGEVLAKSGMKKEQRNHVCHEVWHGEDGVRYEMHFEPSGVPHGKPGELIRSFLSDAVQSAVKTETSLGNMNVPDTFHHGLIILLHTAHHITGEGVGLRHICDWAVFIEELSDDEFLSLFKEKLNQCGLWNFALILTSLCVKYLGCRNRSWLDRIDEILLENLMLDIFKGGNLGQKDLNRGHEALILSDHGKDGIGKKSNFSQLFSSANEIVYDKWKAARKIKILLPFGWTIYGGRYVLRSLIGKRPKINFKDTVKGVNERKDIYKQFRLYEIGENDE